MPWLKNRIELDKAVAEAYYNDFSLLNGKLLAYYGYKEEFRKSLIIPPGIPDIEEVPKENIQKILPYVLEDMNYEVDAINEKMKVFSLEQIIGYIETSIDKGVVYIEHLLN